MSLGSHTRPNGGATVEWYTPPEIVSALGIFDLDPCASENGPRHAHRIYTIAGLEQPWHGRVWLNPPYGPHCGKWLARLAEHGTGTAIVFARTETRMFTDWVWPYASALLFIAGRLHFHKPDGTRAKGNAGGPSVLIAYGAKDAHLLMNSGICGACVTKWGWGE